MTKITIPLLIGLMAIITSVLIQPNLFKKSTPPKIPGKDIRIGFALGDLREERWQKDRDLFVAAAKEQGAYVQVLSANSDADLQNTQVENLISQGVDVLVIAPYDSVKIAKMVDLAHRSKIKVIAYDRLIKNSDLDFYISFDNTKVGRLEAQGIIDVKNKGNFAYIGGAPTDNNSTLLKKGTMEILTPYLDDGSIKLVVNEFMTDWKPEEAYKSIKKYLASGGKLDAIIAANDGTAFGAIRALKEFKLDGKVPVSGQDAELSACQQVVSGVQTLTVYKPIPALAQKAAQLAISIAKDELPVSNATTNNGFKNVPSFFLEPILVNKQNMLTTVVKDGYHTIDQIYQGQP